MADQEVYDETASKILVQGLVAQTDEEMLAAFTALNRHIRSRQASAFDVKVFYAEGSPATWMSSVMGLLKYAEKRRQEAEAAASRYRDRLVLLEAALRRFRSILRGIDGSDTADALLQFRINNRQHQPIDESDEPVTDQDRKLSEFYDKIQSS